MENDIYNNLRMGCSGCKNNREQSSEEKVLEVFEKSLGLQEVQALSIDRILHRYSTGDGMSISQLEKAFSELKIDHGRFQQFYYLFYDSYAYNLKKLNCLGILLGLETVPRKLKILFQNYDTDNSGELSRDELLNMIDDITEVACVLIPRGAISANMDNKLLQSYSEQISGIRKSMIRQLVASMIENKSSITEREFNVSYQNDEGVRNILSTKALREYCLFLKRSILGSVENIMRILNDFNHHDEVKKILGFKSKTHKKPAKRLTN